MSGGAASVFTPIPAPLVTPPRLGLLASAVFPDNVDPRWVNGFSFRSEMCAPGEVAYNCPGDGGTPWGGYNTDTEPGVLEAGWPSSSSWVQVTPVELSVQVSCGADPGTSPDDLIARARRAFLAAESRLLEQEFWTGTATQAAAYPNQYLNDGNATTITPNGGFYALAELQEFAAESFDGRAMIHATHRTVEFWFRNAELRREGNLILDLFDNIVVPGAGYNGTDQNGNYGTFGETEYAFVTPMVHVLRDANITVTPDTPGEALDRDVNDRTYRASRIVAVYHSLCPTGCAYVNLCEPRCTPPGGGAN